MQQELAPTFQIHAVLLGNTLATHFDQFGIGAGDALSLVDAGGKLVDLPATQAYALDRFVLGITSHIGKNDLIGRYWRSKAIRFHGRNLGR